MGCLIPPWTKPNPTQVQQNRKKVSLNAKKVYHSSSEEELDLTSRHEKVQQNRKKVYQEQYLAIISWYLKYSESTA